MLLDLKASLERDLHAEALAKAREVIDLAEFRWNISLQDLQFKFDLTGKTAGMAYLNSGLCRFNSQLLHGNPEAFLNRTVAHEIAHHIAWRIFKDRGHGKYWKAVMRSLGCEPTRCHSYDVSNVPGRHKRPFIYACQCGEHKLTSRLHKGMEAGDRRKCRKCKTLIHFVREED